eukprot:Phypoly_transcript_10309.p1 GENE.Phypoly_transcript_10309~~Phypoly_transcript_10309.p1  ORF type:complete len:343 (+),score=53.94 Phypoly_transcript_10309:109-1137(+)
MIHIYRMYLCINNIHSMEDVSVPQSVPVGYDNGLVPDQFESKDSPLLRVPMYTQQGERFDHLTPAQMQHELSHMQDQINAMQNQLQHQTPQQFPVSPQLPGSPMYPHVVPREYGRVQNQQVPLSPQHPQINLGGSSHHSGGSSLHRNVVNQQMRQHLAPPQPSYRQQLQPQRHPQPQPQQLQNVQNVQNVQNPQLQQHFNQQQQAHQQRLHQQPEHATFGEQVVRKDAMMSYLMDSLNVGQHIGHYGCLVFVMVAHHFMTETAVINYLLKDPAMSPTQAKSLYDQVVAHDYNPPRREKILEFQTHQAFPIIPNTANQDFGNVYKDLRFPDHVYEHIAAYYSH